MYEVLLMLPDYKALLISVSSSSDFHGLKASGDNVYAVVTRDAGSI